MVSSILLNIWPNLGWSMSIPKWPLLRSGPYFTFTLHLRWFISITAKKLSFEQELQWKCAAIEQSIGGNVYRYRADDKLGRFWKDCGLIPASWLNSKSPDNRVVSDVNIYVPHQRDIEFVQGNNKFGHVRRTFSIFVAIQEVCPE